MLLIFVPIPIPILHTSVGHSYIVYQYISDTDNNIGVPHVH